MVYRGKNKFSVLEYLLLKREACFMLAMEVLNGLRSVSVNFLE